MARDEKKWYKIEILGRFILKDKILFYEPIEQED